MKVFLREDEIPRQWYNLAADLPTPLQPPLGPDGNPVTPEALAPVFPMNLIEQEMSTERFIRIPDEVLEKSLLWRPTPLCRARNFEKWL
ncbi:MAG: TrpB-like pyridoxal-phosphate dependent enzyme, partial [Deltaproteobacteria bacterium]|nr:TrpB-like pyridoxal-phosphate dependent enzyme [Deltaproteobacteria bacterium]